MKERRKLKRDTEIIIIAVILLTVVTLSVSYSAFFAVRSQTTVQQITTGTLDVLIDSTSTAMGSDDLLPTNDTDLPTSANAVASGSYAKLVLKNNGTLDADFSVTISYDNLPAGKTLDDVISFNYLNVGIYDADRNEWVNFGTESSKSYYTSIAGLTPTATNTYPILDDIMTAGSTKEYRVYIWLSENTPASEIGKLVYLKLDVKSATVNGRVES